MRGEDFLVPAKLLLGVSDETHRRAAVVLAYFALLSETVAFLAKWGFPMPNGADPHRFAMDCLYHNSEIDIFHLGLAIETLEQFCREATIDLGQNSLFGDATHAKKQYFLAVGITQVLEDIENDPIRRAKVIAAIQAHHP